MATARPIVSVIVPTYNRAHLVGRAIRSILAQTYQDWECLVVDDGSTDNTEEVVRSFSDPRIRYLRHDVNKGVSAARNTGIEAAEGDYVAFLDSDDEWLPEKLERQLAMFRSSREHNLGVVLCGDIRVADDGTILETRLPNARGWVYEELLAMKWLPNTAWLLTRRECLQDACFDESFLALEEWDLCLRLSTKWRFDTLADPLEIKHQHSGPQITHNDMQWLPRLRAIEKYSRELASRPKAHATHRYGLAFSYYRSGLLGPARREMIRSLFLDPWQPRRWAILLAMLGGKRWYGAALDAIQATKRVLRLGKLGVSSKTNRRSA